MSGGITGESVAFAGTTYGSDHDLASATLLQCADELVVVMAAMRSDWVEEEQIQSALTGIVQRMQMAAKVASVRDNEGEEANG